jgi:hypothetical protein
MSYLTKENCKKILKKCIATAVKLLHIINENKNHDDVEIIKKKLIEINNIIESVNNYISLEELN